MAPDQHLGERIKRLRLNLGLTQSELASHADVTKAYLSQIEAGQRKNPSAEVLHKIALALDTTVAQLLEKHVEPPEIKMCIRELDVVVPSSLREYALKEKLDPDEIEMLARIHHKGKQPKTVRGWLYLHESIKRAVK